LIEIAAIVSGVTAACIGVVVVILIVIVMKRRKQRK
jgi:hypothetical protein